MFKSKTSQLTEEMKIWREEAFERQSYYCDMLGDRDWECYTESFRDLINLKNKIGFALFGSPKKNESADQQECKYEEDERKSEKEKVSSEKKESVLNLNCSDKENCNHIEVVESEKLFSNLFLDNEAHVLTKSDNPSGAENSDMLDYENEELIKKFISLFDFETPPEIRESYSNDSGLQDIDSGEDDDELQLEENVPQNPPNNFDNYEMYYTDTEQLKQIDDLIRKIKICSNGEENGKIFIAFIFVIAKIDTFIAEFPIIRVRHTLSANFIDPTGRCYKSWNDFLEDNFFPSCEYCYPKNGFYTYDYKEECIVEFSKSPEARFKRKFGKYADLSTSLAGIGCGVVALASLAVPVAGPLLVGSAVLGGGSGLWGAGRATYQLIERRSHKQDLFDRDARGCWVSIAAGILGAASMGAFSYTTYLARNGKVLGKAASLLVNGVEISNVGVSGLSVLNHGYSMYENKKVTKLDATELVLSLVFFCNSAIRLKTAKTILIESQKEVISGIESQLSRSQKRSFRKLVKSTAKGNSAEGNARVIRTVKNLEDPQTYFKQLNSIRKMANKTKSKITFSEDASGRIMINEKVSVDPELINSMKNKTKRQLFISSKQFSESKINDNKFNRDMKMISKKEQIEFQKGSCEFQRKINVKTTAEFQLNGKKLFSAFKVNDVKNIDELFVAIRNDKNYHKTRPLINEELKQLKSLNPVELINIIFKVCEGIDEAKELYDKLMKFYKDNLKDSFEKFIENIAEMFEKKMIETCNEQKVTCTKLNNTFLRSRAQEKYFSSWDYFEYCLNKLEYDVPERESVIIVPQKVGWLFLCDHLSVHSMFIASIRQCLEREKITSIAMIKNT